MALWRGVSYRRLGQPARLDLLPEQEAQAGFRTSPLIVCSFFRTHVRFMLVSRDAFASLR